MTVVADYFNELYRADPDPWRVRSSWYERRKRALVMAALPRQHYLSTFEPACGAGELTLCLAERSAALLACDYSEVAMSLARRRLSRCGNVQLECRAMPHEWPEAATGKFDLIIVSELAYYLDDGDLAMFSMLCGASLTPGGDLVACHWKHSFHDRLQSTEKIHEAFSAQASLGRVICLQDADFLLEVWRKGLLKNDARVPA